MTEVFWILSIICMYKLIGIIDVVAYHIFFLLIKLLLLLLIITNIHTDHATWHRSCITSLWHMPHVGPWVHHIAHGGSDNWTPCRRTAAVVWPVPSNWRSWSRHTWLKLGRRRWSWRNRSRWRWRKTRTWIGWLDTRQLVDFSFLSLWWHWCSNLTICGQEKSYRLPLIIHN